MALKEDELKALVSYIGIDPDKIEDLGAAKTEFNTKHISREMAVKDSEIKAAVTGAAYGSIFRDAKRTFKDLGVEFEAGEVADNDVKALFEAGKTKVSSRLEELAKAAPDAAEWEKKLQKATGKNSELTELLNSTKARLETVEQEKVQAVKGVKLDVAKKDIFGKIKFSEAVNEVARRGFESIVFEKYNLDIDDETGAAIVLDAKTKAKIQNPDKAGEFATPEQIFSKEAENLGLTAKVDPKRVNLQTQQRVETAPLNSDGVVRNRIAPANAK
jgi:hypothetical protein